MIRQLRIEFTRLRWRRTALVLLAVMVIAPAVIIGATAWNTRPMTEAEATAAQTQVEQEGKDPSYTQDLRACLRNPELYGLDADHGRERCPELTLPQVDWYFTRQPLQLSEEREQSGIAVVVVLVTALLLLGTTFAGHDWNTGSIANQLLTESRRPVLWLAKATVVLLTGLLAASTVLLIFWTSLWGIAEHRGVAPTGSDLTEAYLAGGRGAVLAACAGLLGYATTMLLRSTVATLGLVLATSVIAPLLLGLADFSGSDRLMPQQNFVAIALGGVVIDDFGDNCAAGVPTAGHGSSTCSTRISTGQGAIYYGVLLLGTSAASLALFNRRDVA